MYVFLKVYMNSTQYTISEPRRNNNNSKSKGKSLFYGLHVPFFSLFLFLCSNTSPMNLNSFIVFCFSSFSSQIKQNKIKKKLWLRNRVRELGIEWESNIQTHCNILDLRHSKAYTHYYTLYFFYFSFSILYPKQAGRQASRVYITFSSLTRHSRLICESFHVR